MKKHILSLLMVLSLFKFGYTQAPAAIPYQAVVRNSNGNILPNHSVKLRFTIHDSITTGNMVYQETHTLSTNAQGLVITNIGHGTSNTGTFSGINWGKNNKFVQTELSINNDNSFTDLGTTQFLSVPYALHSKTSENGMPNGNSDGEMLYWSNGQWVKVAPGGYGKPLVMCDGVPSWGSCLPKITSSPVSNTSLVTATCGGNITNDGGSNITARGICWSTSNTPTIDLTTKTTDGLGTGTFSSSMTGLSPNTTYYIRAYATNSAGTSYGNELSFITMSIQSTINNGLVAYYPFNGNANDESGNGNDGAVLTGTTLTTDRYNSANSAYQVDGVNCPTPKGVSLPASITNTEYTISIWCKSNDSTKQSQCVINSYPHGYIGLELNYGLPNTLNKMCSFYGNGPWLTNGDEINWNSFNKQDWKNFVIVKKPNALFFYENGILAFNYPISVLSNPGTINYLIAGAISINGGSGCYETFKGKLDDIRIYNRALTQEEINYLAGH